MKIKKLLQSIKERWKTSSIKERTLFIVIFVLSVYIISPVDFASGIEIDDIIAFIGIVGSYFASRSNNNSERSVSSSTIENELLTQSLDLAKKIKSNKQEND